MWLYVTSLIVLAEAMKTGQASRRGALSAAFGSAPNKAAAAEERAKGRGSWSSTPRIGSGSRQQLRLAAGNSSGLADFVCSPDEQYAGVLRAEAFGELQSKAAAIVQLPDGTLLTLSRDAASNRGTSSIRFSNAKFVLKLAKQASSLSAQDACVLKQLQGTRVACPRLMCASASAILMESAGVPVSPANLPSNYRAQVSVMLDSLQSLGFRHNDIWKRWIYGKKYELEILVDLQGRLRLVDFGTATSKGPTCKTPHCSLGRREFRRMYHPSDDRLVFDVLYAMFRVKKSLKAYRLAGIPGHHGVACRPSAGGLSAFGAYAVLGNGNASLQQGWRSADFSPRSGKPRHERSGLPGLANASVSLPVVADVRLCVEQCKMYPRCSVVSVSSHSKQCLWFDTTKNVTCTATAKKGRVLDDFMSFSVRDHSPTLAATFSSAPRYPSPGYLVREKQL